MEFKTLANTSTIDITAVFNEAFSDYFIKLQLTEATMAAKMKSENILLPYSYGAFENNRLVGFILHGYDVLTGVKTVYNAGTGVIPAFRGRGITQAIYQYCIPFLKREGISHHVLEVIDHNHVAIKIYKQTGFKKTRTFGVYKSDTSIAINKAIAVKEVEEINAEVQEFVSVKPSWQNSLNSIKRDLKTHRVIGAFCEGKLVGYAAYVPASGRVRQAAVHPAHRRKGIGRALFQHMLDSSESSELMVTNIDEAYTPAILFLKALGFNRFLGLYEMKMEV